MTVLQEPHTTAIVTTLTNAGLRVGEGVEPDGVGWEGEASASTFKSYVVVFPISGGARTGNLDDLEIRATMMWQVTCVAPTQKACEILLDRVTAALQGTFVPGSTAVAGRSILKMWHDFGSAQVRRDDDPEPETVSLFYATPRFRLWSAPS